LYPWYESHSIFYSPQKIQTWKKKTQKTGFHTWKHLMMNTCKQKNEKKKEKKRKKKKAMHITYM
jgi:hypothetical protein